MLTTLFSLPAHLLVEDVLIEDQVLTLLITSTLPEMPCPDCRQPSSRVHSRYTRTLADLPCQGRAVRLLIQVRRFFCDGPACTRKTFAEAFPGVAPKYARRTSRQAESLSSIAYALGGRAGARQVKRLSMPTSRYTLVRLLQRASALPFPTPQVLGVDDFAWKKGDRYGTILWNKLMIVTVDEQQKPVTSASIAILSVCLQQTYSTPCAGGSLCAHREPPAQGVLRISDSIGSAT